MWTFYALHLLTSKSYIKTNNCGIDEIVQRIQTFKLILF